MNSLLYTSKARGKYIRMNTSWQKSRPSREKRTPGNFLRLIK